MKEKWNGIGAQNLVALKNFSPGVPALIFQVENKV